MKKTLTIIVLLAIIATAIVWNVRTVISKKNNEAAVTKAGSYTTQTTIAPDTQTGQVSDKGGTPLRYPETTVLSGCMDKTACSYDKDAKNQKNAKCTYAWYSAGATLAFPAKTDTKMLIDDIVAGGTVDLSIKTREVQYDENAAVESIRESNLKSVGKTSTTNAPKLNGTNACERYTTARDAGVFFPAVNNIPVPVQVQRIKILNN